MREKLIKLIRDAVNGCSSYWAGLIADNLIDNDVVPVVRCKVCHNCTKSNWCNLLMMDTKDDNFCSYGERREGE